MYQPFSFFQIKGETSLFASCFAERFHFWFSGKSYYMQNTFSCGAWNTEEQFGFPRKIIPVVSVSRPHLHIGPTVSLKSCLNLCLFKSLKFNLRHVSSLRPLVSCIAKTEFFLGLIKLRIISLNFKQRDCNKQTLLSTSFKYLKKDTSGNCANTK